MITISWCNRKSRKIRRIAQRKVGDPNFCYCAYIICPYGASRFSASWLHLTFFPISLLLYLSGNDRMSGNKGNSTTTKLSSTIVKATDGNTSGVTCTEVPPRAAEWIAHVLGTHENGTSAPSSRLLRFEEGSELDLRLLNSELFICRCELSFAFYFILF